MTDTEYPSPWPVYTVVRWVMAAATMVIISAGLIASWRSLDKDWDAGAIAFLVVLLLPSLIFACGVSRQSTTVWCGTWILVLTALAWVGYYLTRDDPVAGALAISALLVTLPAAIIGVVRDRWGPYS